MLGSGSVCLFPLTPALSLQGMREQIFPPPAEGEGQGGGHSPSAVKSDVKLNHYPMLYHL